MFFKKSLMTLSAAALLAACGGGSDSDSELPSSTITISGAAVKGPMANALISIYKSNADGTQGSLLTSVTSDSVGNYSASVTGYSGVVVIVASVVVGKTTMWDEATGQVITPPATFIMRASLSANAGDTLKAQVNPFTESATAAAQAKTGGLSAVNVEKANSDTAATLTFNPLTTAPTFDANHKPTNSAAGALSAVSQMAHSSAVVGCETGNQSTKVACVIKRFSVNGVNDTNLKPLLQSNITAVSDAAGLPTLTLATPPIATGASTPGEPATPLVQAKAFITMLRSNAKALNATDLSLQTELQAVADDMKNRTAPIASSNVNALNVALLGARFWNDVIKNTNMPFVASKTFYKSNDLWAESIGSCTFYADADYTIQATAKNEAKFVACGSQSQFADFIQATDGNGLYRQCTAVGEWCRTQWSIRVRLTPDVANSNQFTVYTQTRETKLTAKTLLNGYANTFTEARTHYGAAFPGNVATLTTARDANGQINSVKLSGELSPAFNVQSNGSGYYDANLNQWVYKQNQIATVFGDKHNVVLSGDLSTAAGIDKLALSGSMELIKSGTLESRIELAAGSYIQAKADSTGSYSAKDGSQEMLLKLKGGTASSTLMGDLKISAFKVDASGTSYMPTMISFAGGVQRNGVSFFDGTISGEVLNFGSYKANQPTSASNVQTGRINFVGNVIIPIRPAMQLTLSTAVTNTGNSAAMAATTTGQFVQGLITINVNGTSGANNLASDVVTLESTSGIKLVIDTSKASYPLTKGGTAVGVFTPSNNMMTYSDNSYEQF